MVTRTEKEQAIRCRSCAEADDQGRPSNDACRVCIEEWEGRAEEACDLEVDRMAGR